MHCWSFSRRRVHVVASFLCLQGLAFGGGATVCFVRRHGTVNEEGHSIMILVGHLQILPAGEQIFPSLKGSYFTCKGAGHGKELVTAGLLRCN